MCLLLTIRNLYYPAQRSRDTSSLQFTFLISMCASCARFSFLSFYCKMWCNIYLGEGHGIANTSRHWHVRNAMNTFGTTELFNWQAVLNSSSGGGAVWSEMRDSVNGRKIDWTRFRWQFTSNRRDYFISDSFLLLIVFISENFHSKLISFSLFFCKSLIGPVESLV